MKRRLFALAAAVSLLLSIATAAAWAMSYARPAGWRLVGTAHSADLVRVTSGRGTALFTTAATPPGASHHGFWDSWWFRSRSGRLTLMAQVIDYDGTLRRVYASPPSLVVELPNGESPPIVLFGRAPGSGPTERWPGFSFHADAQPSGATGGAVTARGWMVTVPHWFTVLLGWPIPLLWLRHTARSSHATRTPSDPAPPRDR